MGFRGTPNAADFSSLTPEGSAGGADVVSPPAEAPPEDSESPARLLQLAVATADRLVAESKAEARSLVEAARAEADAISGGARSEADRVAAELNRMKDEQTAGLERERAAALAGLEQDRAALEEAIARLRKLQGDHRRQLRDHFEEQLGLLDAVIPKAAAEVVD